MFVVHGQWGEYSPSGSCSETCGPGLQSWIRKCDKPSPSHGGHRCYGSDRKEITCRVISCPGKIFLIWFSFFKINVWITRRYYETDIFFFKIQTVILQLLPPLNLQHRPKYLPKYLLTISRHRQQSFQAQLITKVCIM